MRARPLLAIGVAAAIAGYDAPITPPLPPLLRDAGSDGGGTFSPCDADWTPATGTGSATITARLRRAFPIGAPAAGLRAALVRQGFTLRPPCSPDGRVRWAEFRQGGGGLTHFPAFGSVYWREDAAGRLVWAVGNIAFTGP